ncbi:MAG: hypothetical protein GC145_04310 [Caulobacter sp.]|nr:hypothetical protein [Caulobacter sp.]
MAGPEPWPDLCGPAAGRRLGSGRCPGRIGFARERPIDPRPVGPRPDLDASRRRSAGRGPARPGGPAGPAAGTVGDPAGPGRG